VYDTRQICLKRLIGSFRDTLLANVISRCVTNIVTRRACRTTSLVEAGKVSRIECYIGKSHEAVLVILVLENSIRNFYLLPVLFQILNASFWAWCCQSSFLPLPKTLLCSSNGSVRIGLNYLSPVAIKFFRSLSSTSRFISICLVRSVKHRLLFGWAGSETPQNRQVHYLTSSIH
jgi:hypothetical protein